MSVRSRRGRWIARDFALPGEELARRLLGQRLVRAVDGQRVAGLIVETEAYLGARDKASHAAGGRRTARNESLYGPPGLAYVYFTYGMHHCFNVVGGCPDNQAAVLVRALQPLEGFEFMRRERGGPNGCLLAERQLVSGPGKICQALRIDRGLDGIDLTTSRAIWIEREASPRHPPSRGPRIGLGEVGEWKARRLRFWIPDSVWVSR